MTQPGNHKLTEAVEGQMPATIDANAQKPADAPGTPGQETQREVAEATRRAEQAQDNGKPDQNRDDYLVQVGRAHHTHG